MADDSSGVEAGTWAERVWVTMTCRHVGCSAAALLQQKGSQASTAQGARLGARLFHWEGFLNPRLRAYHLQLFSQALMALGARLASWQQPNPPLPVPCNCKLPEFCDQYSISNCTGCHACLPSAALPMPHPHSLDLLLCDDQRRQVGLRKVPVVCQTLLQSVSQSAVPRQRERTSGTACKHHHTAAYET